MGRKGPPKVPEVSREEQGLGPGALKNRRRQSFLSLLGFRVYGLQPGKGTIPELQKENVREPV